MYSEGDLFLMGKVTTALGKTNYFEEHQHRPPKMEVPYENRSPKIGRCVELFSNIFHSVTAEVS